MSLMQMQRLGEPVRASRARRWFGRARYVLMLTTVIVCGLDLFGALSDRPVLVAAAALYILSASFASFAVLLHVRERRAA